MTAREHAADAGHAERRGATALPSVTAMDGGLVLEDESGASPCRGTCTFDAVARLCIDCGRLAREIREWPDATLQRRREIREAAASRIAPDGFQSSTSHVRT